MALRLASEYRIMALARDEALLGSLTDEIETRGGECHPLVVDLRSPDEIRGGLSGRRVDVLVNNAGLVIRKPLLELTAGDWHDMVDVNFSALFHVVRAVLPGMLSRGTGHIVNVASIAGRSAFVGGTGYAATKHAVLGFSECLMLELREHGIKVSVVMPGSVATGREAFGDDDWRLRPGDVAEAIAGVLAAPPWALVYQVEVRAANPGKR